MMSVLFSGRAITRGVRAQPGYFRPITLAGLLKQLLHLSRLRNALLTQLMQRVPSRQALQYS